MGQALRSRAKAVPVSQEKFILKTESLDIEANGIARRDGKVLFVRDALAGEEVLAQLVRSKAKYDVAQMLEVRKPSVLRVAPRCPHFGVCGGCSMQHLESRAQVSVKQRVLEDTLWHLGKVKAQSVLAPIVGSPWGYRYRARLSVRNVIKKGKVLVGFHEKGSGFVADMQVCHVLPKRVSDLLMPLRDLVTSLSIRDALPQIELAFNDAPQGAGSADVLAMVLRILAPLTAQDDAILLGFATQHRIEFWLQTKGPETVKLFDPSGVAAPSRLAYQLPEFGITMPFKPSDFTQVNHQINAVLVSRALRMLDVQADDRVLDLFCGLGNFTLPLATQAREVVGVEGSASLVARAKQNADANNLGDKAHFDVANLFDCDEAALLKLGRFDRWLIDPPREGALAVVQALLAMQQNQASDGPSFTPKRIVYVSCNPATLARDCAVLVDSGRWVLRSAGVVNMFPHTSHVESIALLEPVIN